MGEPWDDFSIYGLCGQVWRSCFFFLFLFVCLFTLCETTTTWCFFVEGVFGIILDTFFSSLSL